MKKAPLDPALFTERRLDSQGRQHASGRGMSLDSAQGIAIDALVFLAADPERLGCFASLSGLDAGNLRVAAQSPEFLAAILDYLATDERLLLAFAADSGHDPAAVQRACAALSPRQEE